MVAVVRGRRRTGVSEMSSRASRCFAHLCTRGVYFRTFYAPLFAPPPAVRPRRRAAAVAATAAAAANGMLALCHHAATALVTPAVPLTKPSPSQGPPIQPKAPPEHLRVVEDFLDAEFAGELRGCFDEHFAEPRQAHPMRFVWDYWHVPGQYTLHRTQAANYFSPEEYATQG